MNITSEVARRRERHILRAIVWEPGAKFGPRLCEALSWAGHDAWESELGSAARAAAELLAYGKPTTESALMEKCPTLHLEIGSFTGSSEPSPLPVSCIEQEAEDLCRYYRNKKIVMCIQQALHDAQKNIADAPHVAARLIGELKNL